MKWFESYHRSSIMLTILSLPLLLVYKIVKKIFSYKYIISVLIFTFGLSVILFKLLIIDSLPKIDKIAVYKPILSTKFYDRENKFILELGEQKRSFVKIENIPKKLIEAFISAEDRTFYTNCGIDIKGLLFATIVDIKKILNGQRLFGASTITQQVVKNLLLSKERTITRKIKEAILAIKITQTISKDKIMEIYLNQIYLGTHSYGVAMAAKEYFDKTLQDLTVPEMAMLAALPQSPSFLNPFRNKARATQRRNWVLRKMLDNHYITENEYKDYIAADLSKVRMDRKDYNQLYAPIFYARQSLTKSDYNISDNDLLKNGYNIQLSIDSNIQQIAQQALNRMLIDYSKKHGFQGPVDRISKDIIARVNNHKDQYLMQHLFDNVNIPDDIGDFLLAVVMKTNEDQAKLIIRKNSKDVIEDTVKLKNMLWARKKISETELGAAVRSVQDVLQVGDVIVVSQNEAKEIVLEQIPKINGAVVVLSPKTQDILAMVGGYLDIPGNFNRAVQAHRQIGSAVKPFIYSIALENDIKPTDIFIDGDVSINLGNGLVWNPKNHTKQTSGPVTMRTALEKSLNTVTIRIADILKMSKIVSYFQKFGINQNIEPNLSVALGSVESSLLNIVNAYSVFVNNGNLRPLKIINKITDYENKAIISDDVGFYLDPITLLPIKRSNKTEDAKEGLNNEVNTTQVISEQSAFQMISLLQGAVKRGTAFKLNSLNIDIAAKTGTSNDGKDLWTVAMTPEIVVGVYIGYDQPLETGNFGSQFALPVAYKIFDELKNFYHFSLFKSPKDLQYIKINRRTGKRTNQSNDNHNVIYEVFKIKDELPELDDNPLNIDNKIDLDILN